MDCYGRTNVEGVWALGDVSSPYQLKHVANQEARTVAHNLAHPESLREVDHRHVPAAVFTHPQIASVGLTEDEVRAQRVPYVCATQAYGDTAYGWAMEDTTGICKLVADPRTGLLLGAHLMGSQASSLIQPLIQGMSLGQTVAGDGPGPVLDPPRALRGGGERPAQAGAGRGRGPDDVPGHAVTRDAVPS